MTSESYVEEFKGFNNYPTNTEKESMNTTQIVKTTRLIEADHDDLPLAQSAYNFTVSEESDQYSKESVTQCLDSGDADLTPCSISSPCSCPFLTFEREEITITTNLNHEGYDWHTAGIKM